MIGRSGGGISHFFQILHFRMSCLIFDCSIFAIFLVFTWIVEPASVEEKGGEGDQGGETTEHRPEHFFQEKNKTKRKKVTNERRRRTAHQTASQSSVKSRSLSEKNGEEQGEAQLEKDDHLIELEIKSLFILG